MQSRSPVVTATPSLANASPRRAGDTYPFKTCKSIAPHVQQICVHIYGKKPNTMSTL